MGNGRARTMKVEIEFEKQLLSLCELMAYKVLSLMKVVDHAGIDADESPVSSHKHIRWATRFFESFRAVYKLEKTRSQEP